MKVLERYDMLAHNKQCELLTLMVLNTILNLFDVTESTQLAELLRRCRQATASHGEFIALLRVLRRQNRI